jgi:nucleotidyltransferase substrate binding protein (TIGR01987 family)
MNIDIRWKQRLSNSRRALRTLEDAVTLADSRPLSDLERQGLIQAFEFTHELAWNVMKDWFEYQGTTSITGSRDATREAFARGLIVHGEIWMEMIRSRNKSTHTFNLDTAKKIAELILSAYFPEFSLFLREMDRRAADS